MPAIRHHERAALEEILASGVLDRSQNLQRLLTYICERHFEGQDDQVKEYTIATEALGRPADFDQKKDSIVRVEMHRLRKRLAQYYEGPGRDAGVRIVIPEGKYVPQFVEVRVSAVATAADPAAVLPVAPPVEVLPPAMPPAGFSRRQLGIGAALVMTVSVAGAAWIAYSKSPAARPGPEVRTTLEPPLVSSGEGEVRILAGRKDRVVDQSGRIWEPDRYFDGGNVNSTQHLPVTRTANPQLYSGHREGDFTYRIPLEPGSYEARLYFAETVFGEGNPAGGAESSRLFQIYANGTLLEDQLDILADAPGSRSADVKVYKNLGPDASGKLNLEFRPLRSGEPFVNAIEIRRSAPGRIRPIRLVAQPTPVRDAQGRVWEPDQAAEGGMLVKRPLGSVTGGESPELFGGERYGNFRYTIPVARDGVYKVTFYFAEWWFGPGANGGGGEGSRVFQVYVNHQALLANFDLFKAAGAARRALVKTFHGVRPSPQGKLVMEFSPIRNYACVNAIEIEDESPVTPSR
jgi:hypothetical protein